MYTFDNLQMQFGSVLIWTERITVAFFAVDYILRLLTARLLYEDEKDMTELRALRKYFFSFMGIIDLLSFLPCYLPIFFPSGTVAFRMIQIVRIFRLFRINAYYDSLHVIADVIFGKRAQLIADIVVLGAEPYEDDERIELKEVVLKTHNPWTGLRIRDLDISRQSIIVLVKRRNKSLIPNGNMRLEPGDRVFIYTKLHLSDSNNIEI